MLYFPHYDGGFMKYIIIPMTLILAGCGDPNSKATYGDTGLPKNCRAVIQANISEYKKIRSGGQDYELQMNEIDGVMESIDRNCGEYGYAWGDS